MSNVSPGLKLKPVNQEFNFSKVSKFGKTVPFKLFIWFGLWGRMIEKLHHPKFNKKIRLFSIIGLLLLLRIIELMKLVNSMLILYRLICEGRNGSFMFVDKALGGTRMSGLTSWRKFSLFLNRMR